MWSFAQYKMENVFGCISIATLLLGFLYIINVLRRDPNLVKFANQLPGPKGIPLIGNGLEVLKFKGNVGIGSFITNCTQKYGSLYRLWLGNILIVVLSDPADLEVVLFSKKTIRRPPTLADYSAENQITTNTKWKEQRKLQAPYYSNARTKLLMPQIDDHIRKYLSDLYALSGKGEFDIFDYIQYWSFNYHLNIHMDINQEFSFGDVKKLFDESRPLDNFSSKFYAISNILRIVFTILNRTKERETTVHELVEKLIKNNLPDEPTEKEFSDQINKFGLPLLSAIRKFETEEKVKNCLLYNMEEILKLVSSHVFPANTGLIIDFYNLHHNPKYYPNPEKIDPDRFLPENINARPKCSFLPFSEGPRGCLGKNFALTSMKLMAIALLQNFSFNTNEKCENIQFSGGFIRQSVNGYKVSLKLRQS